MEALLLKKQKQSKKTIKGQNEFFFDFVKRLIAYNFSAKVRPKRTFFQIFRLVRNKTYEIW